MITDKEKLLDIRKHCKDLNSNDTAVQSLDFSGSIVNVSPAWLKLTGYKIDDVIGKHFVEFLAQESLLKVNHCFPRLKDYGYVDHISLKIQCKDKHIISVSLTGTSKYNSQGEFERTFCEILPNDY